MDCVVKVQKSKLKLQVNIARQPNGFTFLGRMVTLSIIAISRAIAGPYFIPIIKCNAVPSERRDATPSYFRFRRLFLLLVPWGE